MDNDMTASEVLARIDALGARNVKLAVTDIDGVLRGKYVSRGLAESLAMHLNETGDRPRHETLSDREFQVLGLMGAGKSLTEIADTLSLSVKTVSTYRARILKKLALKSSAEIIQYTIQNRLVPSE